MIIQKKNISKLNDDILLIEGMSGKKTRHLYNNLCNLDNGNYLEIGVYKGSSFISSIYNNNINALAIDNWSQFNSSKNIFINNVKNYCPNNNFNFIEKNCFDIDKCDINKYLDGVDVYLYDGDHTYEAHKRSITHFFPFLSKYSIIIIDDWRTDNGWDKVQNGTYAGLNEVNLKVHKFIEHITFQEETGPTEYWNGFGLFVCEKV
jgi:hypothetical protein